MNRLWLSLGRTAAVVTLAASLGGCISLFPKADPVQLYRLTAQSEASAAPSAIDGARAGVGLAPVEFDRAAAGDRILTIANSEAAYIADARWVASAQSQFIQALENTFERRATASRLVGRGELTASSLMLDLDVRNFEARYLNGREAPPTATVVIRGRLIRYPDRAVVRERVFEATARAPDNRVGAIVPAFDEATGKALGDLVAWVDEAVASRPAD